MSIKVECPECGQKYNNTIMVSGEAALCYHCAVKQEVLAEVGPALQSLETSSSSEAHAIFDLMKDVIEDSIVYNGLNAQETVKHLVGVAEELKGWAQDFMDQIDFSGVDKLAQELENSKYNEDFVVSILDELAHDTASRAASEINNQGVEAQVCFLLSNGWTKEEVLERIKDEYEDNQ